MTAWLAEAELTDEMLPDTPALTCPVNGDVSADPILHPDGEISNDLPAFAAIGAETATGRPIQSFGEGKFVLSEISETLDDELTGGYVSLPEEADETNPFPAFLFVLLPILVLALILFILFNRKRRSKK